MVTYISLDTDQTVLYAQISKNRSTNKLFPTFIESIYRASSIGREVNILSFKHELAI